MAGPWEQYQSQDGPWTQYASAPAPSAPAPRKPAPQAPQKAPGWMDQVAGFMTNVNRGTGVLDELQGVFQAGANIATGKDTLSLGALQRGMAQVRGAEDQFSAQHPLVAAGARGTGGAATVLVPVGAGAQGLAQGGRLVGAARGAVAAGAQAGAFGLADRGSAQERVAAAGSNAVNPVVLTLGAAAGALTARSAPKKPAAPTPQKTLQQAGVFLTPGQKVGGIVKNAEDLAQRAPILGPAIIGARQRANASLNRAAANQALAPIGKTVPANVKPGHEAVDYVASELGKEYDRAASLVGQTPIDAQFKEAMVAIGQVSSELPPDVKAQFDAIVLNRLNPRVQGGTLDGATVRQIQSELGNIASRYGSSGDAAHRAMAEHIGEISQALSDFLGRASPEAEAIIGRANQGYRRYAVLRAAAGKSNTDGIFTPGQLSTAVRTTDKSVGKGNVAKGKATMQDLSSAASQVMPDAFGNPGTANAVGLGSGAVGLITAPGPTIGAGIGLTAAATPYWLMGRKVVDSLPANASRAEIAAAAEKLKALAANDPRVAQLQQQLASRLARSAGLAGAIGQAPVSGAASQ